MGYCVDVCTDGAKAMTGKTSGVISRIKQKVKECSSSHYVLHRHALAVKKMQLILSNYDLRVQGYSKCCVKTLGVYIRLYFFTQK